ncbi:hypothetical protein [Hamadaea tsunoensis]|uniref:hypothetical protein n=1 Tax=Hamadaea tsunoensis TaxID=53368 RepID=UPI0003FF5F98|nr:hypothetical protein [Hamadaea tsunoensis]
MGRFLAKTLLFLAAGAAGVLLSIWLFRVFRDPRPGIAITAIWVLLYVRLLWRQIPADVRNEDPDVPFFESRSARRERHWAEIEARAEEWHRNRRHRAREARRRK